MNPDQTSVQSAYEDTVKQLYIALFNAYISAAGDAAQEQQADQHFTTGLGFARKARDRALALVA